MGVMLWGASPLCFGSSISLEVSILNDCLTKKLTRGEGNCVEVTKRGKEAFECAGKLIENRRQPLSRQDPPGDEQKPHNRPVALGERA